MKNLIFFVIFILFSCENKPRNNPLDNVNNELTNSFHNINLFDMYYLNVKTKINSAITMEKKFLELEQNKNI